MQSFRSRTKEDVLRGCLGHGDQLLRQTVYLYLGSFIPGTIFFSNGSKSVYTLSCLKCGVNYTLKHAVPAPHYAMKHLYAVSRQVKTNAFTQWIHSMLPSRHSLATFHHAHGGCITHQHPLL